MATLLVTYNLNGSDDGYKDLFKLIEGLGDTWHNAKQLDSVWFVKTTKTPSEVDSLLEPAFDGNDNRFIVDITGQPRQGWMPKGLWEWLRG